MGKKIVFIFFICTACSVKTLAQTDSLRTISGETMDVQYEPIPFVCIKIAGSEQTVFSNAEGKFQIKAQATDTLVFSATSYQTLKFAVKKLRTDYNYISLVEEVYQLGTVDVSAMRWLDFKYEMMHKELKPTEQKIIVIKGLPNPYQVLVPAKISPIMNPATFLYQYFKKENIRKRKQKRWRNIYEESQIKINNSD